jgi:hypothetical protein
MKQFVSYSKVILENSINFLQGVLQIHPTEITIPIRNSIISSPPIVLLPHLILGIIALSEKDFFTPLTPDFLQLFTRNMRALESLCLLDKESRDSEKEYLERLSKMQKPEQIIEIQTPHDYPRDCEDEKMIRIPGASTFFIFIFLFPYKFF